ncbi:Isoleucine--tRNA ligase [uncultured archaeon]|nr:Isoleucine--tRNA ligase [uncultured archaeon]
MLDVIKSEEEILKYWKDNDIMAKVRAKNKDCKPFYFLDGPPFVSGDLHPGQMWVKSMKDVILRYRRLRGFDVYDRAGYDVHGLPIEKKVEANLKIGSKKEIETAIGIEKFVASCKEFVSAYIGRMDADYYRFGISLDFSNPYLPYKNEYMETEWWFLKKMWDKGLIYSEKKATFYCPVCGTALSQGGMETTYMDDTDPSVYVAFKINTKLSDAKIAVDDNTFLLIWTTTPWTLPANVAVAANPKERYIKAKLGDRSYIIAKSRLEQVVQATGDSAIIESEFYGSDLDGIHYLSPLEAAVPMQKKLRKQHRIVMSEELVSSTEGSGLVHIAPGHGLEDYALGKKNHLPVFSPVSEQAAYTEEAGVYMALKVPGEANERVLQDLEANGALISKGTITHSYPHCWRCDSKLISIATRQWFANVQKVKKKLLLENGKVNWHPEEATKWQEDVLKSSPDWCISRQRYWGAPMPIWECECGEQKVVGSLAELREHAVDKAVVDGLNDLHRPYIDAVKLRCDRCGKEMKRIPDVLDVWFDSGVAFKASLTDEQFGKLFPTDFILEAIEQLRGWFSYQLKVGTMVYGKRPFKNVSMHGMMLGADGREMHKKTGNYLPLNDLLKKSTADSFRIWCTSHVPQYDLLFSEEKIKEAEKTVILLHNVTNLIKEYASSIDYSADESKIRAPASLDKLSHEDAWIVSKLNTVIRDATLHLDNYETYKYVSEVRDFAVNDFSRVYLKIAKKRILYESRASARRTMDIINYVFYNLLILLSPVAPFATEKQYLSSYGNAKSVSLLSWPKYKEKLIRKELEDDFAMAIDAIGALLNAREKADMKLRWPLANGTIEVKDAHAELALGRLAGIIEDFTNIKRVTVKTVAGFGKEIRPVFTKIGPEFKANAQAVAEALKKEDADGVENAVKSSGHYSLHTERGLFDIKAEHFTVLEKLENPDAAPFKQGVAHVDKEISKELWEEAMVREFERRVQMARKEAGLSKADRIDLFYEANATLDGLITRNAKAIKSYVNARAMRNQIKDGARAKEFDIEDEKVRLEMERIAPESH